MIKFTTIQNYKSAQSDLSLYVKSYGEECEHQILVVPDLFLYHKYYLKHIEYFADKCKHCGLTVFDWPGSGLSSGSRNKQGRWSEWKTDLRNIVLERGLLEREKLSIFSEGIGALVSLGFVASLPEEEQKKINLVLINPTIKLNNSLLSLTSKFLMFFKAQLGGGLFLSAHRRFLQRYINDPLVYRRVNRRLWRNVDEYSQTVRDQDPIVARSLVVWGKDQYLSDQRYSKDFIADICGYDYESIVEDSIEHHLFLASKNDGAIDVMSKITRWVLQ